MKRTASWFSSILIFFLMAEILATYQAHAQKQVKGSVARPNIVLFIADDLGWTDIGPYGNDVVKTPNLDGFSRESLTFHHAFAGSPTCGPSRSSLLTGLLPFRHGAHGNHSGVREHTRSVVQYLAPLGYDVAIAGKLHVGPKEVFSFERISGTNVPEKGFEHKPGLNYDLSMDPVEDWLSARRKDVPFLLIVAEHSPHVVWPERSRYDTRKIDIPTIHIDTEDTRKARARYYEDITKMDGNFGRLVRSLKENRFTDNTIVVFTADQGPQWPFAKWSLYEGGVHVPLLIRWPDVVKAGSQTQAMVSQVDLLPTFVEVAGGAPPDSIDGSSFIQVLKSLSDTHRDVIFASHTGDGMMNRSPARMLRTSRFKYILNLAPENVYHTHIDKAKDHDGGREYWDSWIKRAESDPHAAAVLQRYHDHPREELYDLEVDPNEIHNLADDSAYAETLATYRIEMSAWREDQGDFETGPEQLERVASPRKGPPVAPYVFVE
jgi:uncharacterized sulfatase